MPALETEAQELIDSMRLCSAFMSNIMNNLLDVRKMEEGKMVLKSDPLSLSALVEDVRKMTLPSAKSGVEMRIEINIPSDKTDYVLGDVYRLQQVLNNLATNAIKYTSEGSITLVAGWERDRVRLECQDTGPGIPKNEQDNLFERFVMRGGAPGSGLGLAIAKQIVDLMHGTIRFESDPSVRPGTSCIVLLPLLPCHDITSMVSAKHEDEHLIDEAFSMLLIDDIKMNRAMLKRRIQKNIAPQCTITEAATGEEALQICNSGVTFDVIVVDQYMEEAGGVMVGTDVIATMRRSKIDSYIIGCSGNDLDATFLAAGADLVWRKPMPTNDEMIRHFRSGLEKRSSAA